MLAHKIQIIKCSKGTYWYRESIGETFWATKGELDFCIIKEGTIKSTDTIRFVDFDDVLILEESDVVVERIESIVITKLEY